MQFVTYMNELGTCWEHQNCQHKCNWDEKQQLSYFQNNKIHI